jgi:hypothetical protein
MSWAWCTSLGGRMKQTDFACPAMVCIVEPDGSGLQLTHMTRNDAVCLEYELILQVSLYRRANPDCDAAHPHCVCLYF